MAPPQDFRFEEATEFRGANGVQTARGLIEEQDAWLMKQSAGETEALDGARGERAYLAIQGSVEFELCREQRDSLGCRGVRKLIQLSEKKQILTSGEARVEAMVGAGVVTEAAADIARFANRVVSCDTRAAARRHEKRGKNPQQRGFAGAVRTEDRHRFTRADFERHARQCDGCRFFKWLEKSAPAAARRGKHLLKRFNSDRGFGHQKTYSLSAVRRQCGCALPVRTREGIADAL